jgi:hypothetical protein
LPTKEVSNSLDACSWSASLVVLPHDPLAPEDYKRLLHGIPRLEHVLIEVNRCPGEISRAPG